MNRQKEIVITVTYNELGIIVDTKAEPRKKGKWQTICLTSYPPRYRKRCSVCGGDMCTSEEYNFCPNCGAYMMKG